MDVLNQHQKEALNHQTLKTVQEITRVIRSNPNSLTPAYITSIRQQIQNLLTGHALPAGTEHQLRILDEKLKTVLAGTETIDQLQSLKQSLEPHLKTAQKLLKDPPYTHTEITAWHWYNQVGDLVDAAQQSPPTSAQIDEMMRLLQSVNEVQRDVYEAIKQGRFVAQTTSSESKIAQESQAWTQVEQIARRITAPITDEQRNTYLRHLQTTVESWHTTPLAQRAQEVIELIRQKQTQDSAPNYVTPATEPTPEPTAATPEKLETSTENQKNAEALIAKVEQAMTDSSDFPNVRELTLLSMKVGAEYMRLSKLTDVKPDTLTRIDHLNKRLDLYCDVLKELRPLIKLKQGLVEPSAVLLPETAVIEQLKTFNLPLLEKTVRELINSLEQSRGLLDWISNPATRDVITNALDGSEEPQVGYQQIGEITKALPWLKIAHSNEWPTSEMVTKDALQTFFELLHLYRGILEKRRSEKAVAPRSLNRGISIISELSGDKQLRADFGVDQNPLVADSFPWLITDLFKSESLDFVNSQANLAQKKKLHELLVRLSNLPHTKGNNVYVLELQIDFQKSAAWSATIFAESNPDLQAALLEKSTRAEKPEVEPEGNGLDGLTLFDYQNSLAYGEVPVQIAAMGQKILRGLYGDNPPSGIEIVPHTQTLSGAGYLFVLVDKSGVTSTVQYIKVSPSAINHNRHALADQLQGDFDYQVQLAGVDLPYSDDAGVTHNANTIDKVIKLDDGTEAILMKQVIDSSLISKLDMEPDKKRELIRTAVRQVASFMSNFLAEHPNDFAVPSDWGYEKLKALKTEVKGIGIVPESIRADQPQVGFYDFAVKIDKYPAYYKPREHRFLYIIPGLILTMSGHSDLLIDLDSISPSAARVYDNAPIMAKESFRERMDQYKKTVDQIFADLGFPNLLAALEQAVADPPPQLKASRKWTVEGLKRMQAAL